MTVNTNGVLSTPEEKITQIEKQNHDKWIAQGFTVAGTTKKTLNGRTVEEVTYRKGDDSSPDGKISKVEQRVRKAQAITGTILTAGLANISKDFREEKMEMGFTGEITRTHTYSEFSPSNKKVKQVYERSNGNTRRAYRNELGFDPKNQKSVADRAAQLKTEGKLIGYPKDHPHLVYPEWKGGGSRMIFCPNGDTTKAMSFKMWDADTGLPLKDKNKVMLAMYDFAIMYEEAQKGIDKAAEKLVEEINAGNPAQAMTKEHVLRTLKSLPLEIDVTNGNVYIHSHNAAGARTGILLESISKDTWKNINRAHNKKETEMKQDLNGVDPTEHERNGNNNVRPPAPAPRSEPIIEEVVDDDSLA